MSIKWLPEKDKKNKEKTNNETMITVKNPDKEKLPEEAFDSMLITVSKFT